MDAVGEDLQLHYSKGNFFKLFLVLNNMLPQ